MSVYGLAGQGSITRLCFRRCSCNIGSACSMTTLSLTPCRPCTACHPSADDGQILPGTTIAPDLALRLDADPHTDPSVL
jgi:hypothetical protein